MFIVYCFSFIIFYLVNSSSAYKSAYTKSSEALPPTNPVHLGLVLNYSVFLYEIEHNAATACKVAKEVSMFVGTSW